VHDKMGRLNHHSIIKLKEEGYKPLQILWILESEGVEISGVSAAVQTKPDTVDVSTTAKGKRSNGRLNFDAQMESNDELTSPRLQQLI
jgi:hypothetical protein